MRRHQSKLNWARIVVELVVVTVGVLLALALDQWIASRRERAEEALLLGAVKQELQTIASEIEMELGMRRAIWKSVNRIFEMSVSDSPPDPAEFDSLLGDSLWYSNTHLPLSTIESILSSGKLRIIQNDRVRTFVASMPERLVWIRQAESADLGNWTNVVMPFMRTNTNLPQIVSTVTARPEMPEGARPIFPFPPGERRDHRELLKNPEYLAIAVQIGICQNQLVFDYETLLPEVTEVVGLIDAELAD